MTTTYLLLIASKLVQFHIKKHPVKQDGLLVKSSKLSTLVLFKPFIIAAMKPNCVAAGSQRSGLTKRFCTCPWNRDQRTRRTRNKPLGSSTSKRRERDMPSIGFKNVVERLTPVTTRADLPPR